MAPLAPPPLARPCPFTTFYSFKGGVGRSMAVINVAGILASRGFRVLVIDIDLEAPGLSYLASQSATHPELADSSTSDAIGAERRIQLQPGFVDFLLDAVERGEDGDLFHLPPNEALRRYTAPYELPEEFKRDPGASLHIMPAGRLDDEYATRLERLDLPGLYREGNGLPLLNLFKQVVRSSELFDYVFIDSRTGFSDESGICTRDLADHLMIVSGLNKQNVEGTAQFLAALRVATGGNKPLEVILSPVPNGEDKLVEERERAAHHAFCRAWGSKVATDLHIPYHPQLALTEEPHIFRRRKGYLYEAYHQIEARVREHLGDTPEALRDAALNAVNDKDYSAAAMCLRRASLLADSPEWLDRFLVQFAASKSMPEITAAEELYSFVRERASKPARAGVAGRIAWQAYAMPQNDARPLFQAALAIDPTSSEALAAYALFHWQNLRDPDSAEVFFRRSIDAAPHLAYNLSNFANFLWRERNDLDVAESFFRRAIVAAPNHPNYLGNLANFLWRERKDLDAAENFFRRAIDADPNHPINLSYFATFLWQNRKDLDTAESFFRRAIDADPNNALGLGLYALFLCEERKRIDIAVSFYRRAIDINPNDPNNLANYARLCLVTARVSEGLKLVEKAIVLIAEKPPSAINAECWMYIYCCGEADQRDKALTNLRSLVTGYHVTTGKWDFSGVIQQAQRMGHPEATWLPALAEVLAGRSPPSSLDAWEAWRADSTST